MTLRWIRRSHQLPKVHTWLLPAVAVAISLFGNSIRSETTSATVRAVGIASRVDSSPAARPADNWLVAVGIDRFNDVTVTPLAYAAADARAIHDFFSSTGFVSPSQAYLLVTNVPEEKNRPTRSNIFRAVQYVADHATSESTILVSFSCHGFVDERTRESYLLPEDGDVAVLRHTAVRVKELNEMLEGSPALRKVLFIDACRNTPRRGARGGDGPADAAAFHEALKAGRGQVTLFSCNVGQFSYEAPDTGHGIFTHFLLQGLRGAARADADGLITVASLQEYLSRVVPDWCRKDRRQPQEPWLWGALGAPIPLAAVGKVPTAPVSDTSALDNLTRRATDAERLLAEARTAYAKAEALDANQTLTPTEKVNAWQTALRVCEAAGFRVPDVRSRISQWKGDTGQGSYTEDAGCALGLKMVWINGGVFEMGSQGREPGHKADEGPAHAARLAGFWMADAEVTVQQFGAFVGATRYVTDAEKKGESLAISGGGEFLVQAGLSWQKSGAVQTSWHPVVHVSWNDAMKFCEWLSQITGRDYSLPTEAQWEYACRSGSQSSYEWGNEIANGENQGNFADQTAQSRYPAWKNLSVFPFADGLLHTAPVRNFRPTRWGLFDMHGNVAEWCLDYYDPNYYDVTGVDDNPAGPRRGMGRTIRGGSWADVPRNVRCAARAYNNPVFSCDHVGFRVCCRLPGSSQKPLHSADAATTNSQQLR